MAKKKALLGVVCLAMVALIAVFGTVAFLTDRDAETNVFTSGDVAIELSEDFEQGAELIPGVDIEKEATITNTGKNDAYVWMTIAVPEALDTVGDASKNVIHWNVPGAFWNGYQDKQYYIDSAIEAGYLPAGSTGVAADKTWNVDDKVAVQKGVDIKGASYNVYTLLYNSAIAPGETTNIGLSKVYLDTHIDVAPNGDWNWVDNGTATPVGWNTNTNGNPKIYVAAYGIQMVGLADADNDNDVDVEDAYAAYIGQWGKLNADYGNAPVLVEDVDDMRQQMKVNGAEIALTEDLLINDDKGTGYALYAKYDTTIDLNGNDIIVDLDGKEFYGMIYALDGAKVDIVGDGNIEINGGIGPFVWCTGANGATEVNIYGGNWTQASPDFETDYCEGLYANREGVVNIYGGMFDWGEHAEYTINESREGVVNVYGGTFVNFDPRVSHDSDGSYVAAGYTVVSETQANGDIWYTVVPE